MNIELLKRLCEISSISGSEQSMRKAVAEEMRPLVDTVEADVMGNLIGVKIGPGNGPRVMIAAHIDEIGFRVRSIDSKGFISLHAVGGWDPRAMFAQRVLVHGFAGTVLPGTLMPGIRPKHLQSPEEASKATKLEDYFVDLGLPAEKVKSMVEVGDMVTMNRTCELIGDTVVSKALDNRLSVFVMIEALRMVQAMPLTATILAVATTQEEVGVRGAKTAAYALKPDIGIALDVTLAVDIPGTPESESVTQLGNGTAIKVQDGSLICHPKVVRHFRDLAEEKGIKYQLELLPHGGTDASAVQLSRSGVPSFTLSTPTRYVHTVNEMAHLDDIQASIDLLAAFLESAGTRDYGYSGEF